MTKHILQETPLGVALLILIVSIVFFIYGYGLVRLPTIYWLFIHGTATPSLAVLCIPIIFLILMLWIKFVPQSERKSIYLLVGRMMLIANILMCVSVVPMALATYRHHGSVTLHEHIYFASSGWKPGVGGTYLGAFYLFQCDSLGILCDIVHSEWMEGIPLQEWKTITAFVDADTDENTVLLQINREIVYTHHP